MKPSSRRHTGQHTALRVLLIANTLPPHDISGVGEQVLQLAAGLREQGVDVHVLGRGDGGARGPKLLFPLTVALPAALAVWRDRPDVVQVHESDGALAALVTRLLRRFLRASARGRSEDGAATPRLLALLQVSYCRERHAVRPLRDEHGRELGRPGAVERRFRRFKAPLHIVLGWLTARLADQLLTPSAVTADEVSRDYGVERQSIEVLPNVTGAVLEGRETVAKDFAAPVSEDAETAFLFVGRLRLRKGVEVLLAALEALHAEHPDARLWIAGEGEHRQALEEACRQRALSDVTFLGRCDARRVRELLSAARALVVPSIYEGMPLVVLEAMEAGTPVIASRVSGIPEVVVDGETGWLVPAENVDALRTALVEAWSQPGESRRRGAAGRRRLDDNFRPHHAAQHWLRAIQT